MQTIIGFRGHTSGLPLCLGRMLFDSRCVTVVAKARF